MATLNSTLSDQELWWRFADASTSREFCEGWLSLQCRMIPGTQCALVLLGAPDRGPFKLAAVWPRPDVNVTHLTAAAEQALKERRGLTVRAERNDAPDNLLPVSCHVAYPVEVSGKIHGVVVLDVNAPMDEQLHSAAKQLHWGAAWLEVLLRRNEESIAGNAHERLKQVLESISATLEHARFKPAAMAFVTHLATLLEADRVSVGFMDGKNLAISALSHSAEFGERVNLMRAIAAAMEEALDQQELVVYPPPPDFPHLITREHASLERQYGTGAICTVPVGIEGRFFGALTLEFPAGRTLDEGDVEFIKAVSSLAGSILETKRKEDRLLITKAADTLRDKFRKLLGPSHLALKIIGITIVILAIFFLFVKADYRVKAPTVLEGSVQRVVSAPFKGYVINAPKRAGDVVRQGELLCLIDDRELQLEHRKWTTQREQFQKEHREAFAKHDRAQVTIISAKLNQAEAQIALLDEQLSRTRMVAPFDGIVTSGDLSQSLGSPVEQGQVLFEVAPLDSYRVILQVDERDITEVKMGQRGNLVLPSLPGEVFPLQISAITPVSTAKEGRNYFRVEARLDKVSKRLRPGMEGVGKIEIEQRKLIWIWTHEAVNWVRLKIWSWLP